MGRVAHNLANKSLPEFVQVPSLIVATAMAY